MAGLVGVYRRGESATEQDEARVDEMVRASLEAGQYAAVHRVGPLAVAYLGYEFEQDRFAEHVDFEHPDIDVVFSGYLFNDQEIRALAADGARTLPAGIRALYRRDPESFVEQLDGRFLLLLFDRPKHRLIVATDRHGMVPIYVRERDDTFVFASSLIAHQVKSAPPLTLDRAATTLYLMYRHFVGEGTYFREVFQPCAATLFTLEGPELRRREYWRFRLREEAPFKRPEEHVEEMGAAFEAAMARIAREPGSIAVPLSGGLDSRAISAQLRREGRAFANYTFGREGCRDIVIAKAVAGQLGAPHHVADLGPDYLREKATLIARRTDGAYPIDHGHIAAILDAVTPHHQLVIDGLTGEMLSSEKVDDTTSTIDEAEAFGWINKRYQTTSDRLVQLLSPELPGREALLHSGGGGLTTRGHRLRGSVIDLFGVEQRQRRFCLSGPRILGGDMRVFCPFWSNGYADSVFSAAPQERAVQRPYIMLHRKLWPDMARIRWNKTGLPPVAPVAAHRAAIPLDSGLSWVFEQVQKRTPLMPRLLPYKGYERYNDWFRQDQGLRSFVREVLLDPRTLERGIYTAAGIRQLIDEQERGRGRHADVISQLIGTELFFRQVDAERR